MDSKDRTVEQAEIILELVVRLLKFHPKVSKKVLGSQIYDIKTKTYTPFEDMINEFLHPEYSQETIDERVEWLKERGAL